ncbi:MAG: hypothetical protein FJ109_12950 [Deltaproteobacteria bacterium]|nr:hypothetical protein [Deltaproteobacteria bacterium]
MRLSFEQINEIFGRSAVMPGDGLSVNGTEYTIDSVDAQGAVFVEITNDGCDDDESSDEEEDD